MIYVSIQYVFLVLIILFLYYLLPIRFRWTALLFADLCFLFYFAKDYLWVSFATIFIAWLGGVLLSDSKVKERASLSGTILVIFIFLVSIPWVIPRFASLILSIVSGNLSGGGQVVPLGALSILVPLGISFYTMQLIAYLVDVYKHQANCEKNILKFALFATFFPQYVQGPIPRSSKLHNQLITGHRFDEENIRIGVYQIVWGLFLKYMIADKAGIYVDNVYTSFPQYQGAYIWIAIILYSFQLYADFSACTMLALGASRLFGIKLENNFLQPYFAKSISEFWRRWHISFSSWLKDYIYIPLGGSKKGMFRKYLNICITFIFSGFWHGVGLNYLFWGLTHSFYQIAGSLAKSPKDRITGKVADKLGEKASKCLQQIITFFLVSFAWIFFRAQSFMQGLRMIKSMFCVFNPWVITSQEYLSLGLDYREFVILLISLLFLLWFSSRQERGDDLFDRFYKLPTVIRWIILIVFIFAIIIMGTYGYGFDAKEFIYGGF